MVRSSFEERMTTAHGQPLSSIETGTSARVVSIAGGRAFQGRLISMGLTVGSRLQVVRSNRGGGGPVLISTGQTRLAIGRGMSDRIYVVPA